MSEVQSLSYGVTAAFDSQLKSLCIKEFPCGYGTWRVPDTTSVTTLKTITSPGIVPSANLEATAQHETAEELQELAVKTPYHVDCSWSNDATTLREIAVKAPEKLSNTFILSHFKSLRIVDKKVTEIDEGLLQFKNLQQLTLSANLISYVDSKRLPKCLQELELAANQISDISLLCLSPPPLIHLGLGYNLISSIAGHMRPSTWNHLLSLDMSYNNLSDLYGTVNVLKALPKLRNLVMQGNPLALVPGYRGYVIDSIRPLTILDDRRMTADEKHYFKGLAKLREIPLDESRMTIAVDVIKGVKMPPEMEDPESNVEYPKIEHKYHVEFKFLELPFVKRVVSPVPSVPTISITSPEEEESKTEPYVDEQELTEMTATDTGALKLNATESHPWVEESIEIAFSKDFHTRNLNGLRDFFREGIEFTVIETKHSYVLEDPNAAADEAKQPSSAKGRPDSKSDKGKKSGNKDKDKDKDKRKESAKPKVKDGKGKKGKQEEVEMFELPRQQRPLGSCHVALTSLLEGEFEVTTECICEEEKTGDDSEETGDTSKTDGNEKKKGGKGDLPDKAGKAGPKAASDVKKGGKDVRGKSAMKGSKDEKAKGKGKDEDIAEDDEQPPPPLSVNIKITLHQWKSAKEATVAQEITQTN